jgi:transposase
MGHPRYVVGLDIAAETFTATILSPPDQIVLVSEQIPNGPEGYQRFLLELKQHHVGRKSGVVVMEATGVYGEQLCYVLYANGYQVAVEPPNAVKKAFRFKQKNDTVDSRQIAEYGYRFFDTLRYWKPRTEILEQIQTLLTTREQLVKQRTASQNALQMLRRKVIQTPLAMTTYEENVQRLGEQIKRIDQAIKELIDQDPTLRQKGNLADRVPGVGLLLTANLMVITDGFCHHVNPKSLAAYLGICPYEHTSGTSVRRKDRSDRRGTGRIRKLLYLASLSVKEHNRPFKAYFYRKVAEGKSHRLVLNNIANRLLKIICATVKSEIPYHENYRSIHPALVK